MYDRVPRNRDFHHARQVLIEPQDVVRLRVDPDPAPHAAFDVEADAVVAPFNQLRVDGRLLQQLEVDHDRGAAIDRLPAGQLELVLWAVR